MEFESIILVVEKEKVEVVKELINTIKYLKQNIVVTSFLFENIGEEVIVSFKIDTESYSYMLEKLLFNKIRILSVEKKNEELLESIKTKLNKRSSDFVGWGGVKTKPSTTKPKTLDEFVAEGNYKEVIKLSKNITLNSALQEKAKSAIPDVINHALENAFKIGLKGRFDVDEAISKLIEIASDRNLKALNKISEMKQAGFLAIELCIRNRDNYTDLILIANNSSIHNLVNVKAVIKFSQLVMINVEEYESELQSAIRTLNTRWLNIAIESVRSDLTELETAEFGKIITYVILRRK
ncbi:MAG: hypothetical protein NTX22_05690 [Ignavibacteriales bacterium]|nr:hypothetical protein [Ignavibacteriales bacterium]